MRGFDLRSAFLGKWLPAALLCLCPLQAWTACSEYMGLAVINEANKEKQKSDAAGDFVEIKLLDNSIPASVYKSWNLQICDSVDGCTTVSVGTADEGGSPWLVIGGLSVGTHLDFTADTDILLTDSNGDPIDYLTTGGNIINQPSCDFTYDTTVTTGSQTRRVQRSPDGTGEWTEPPGESEGSTDSTTNDGSVPADAPSLSVDDVSVVAGGSLAFTLTLTEAYSEDVTVDYQTADNTAVAGVDYTAASGTATILQGDTTTTVTVDSFAAGGGVFYLSLSNADNAVITDQVGKGLIIPNPLAEWRFDEYGWRGETGEVDDASGNGLHGLAMNDATTTDSTPAIVGSPGTCYYGDFDGADDYVTIGDNSLLDLTDGLTIAAWVKPVSGGSGIETIVTKGNADTYSYSLRLTADQKLEFSWCISRTTANCDAGQSVTSSASLTLDAWSHVAIAFSQGEQRLYINGNQDGADTSTAAISPNDGNLLLGSSTTATGTEHEFSGAIDEVRMYKSALGGLLISEIMNETRVCVPATLDHYHISFDGGVSATDSTAITCEPASVTITAHPEGHLGTVIPGSSTTLNLSTSTGQGYWSSPSAGAIADNGGGNAAYDFSGGNQSVTLQLNHTVPALVPNSVNIDIDGGSGEHIDEDPNVEFLEAGFRFIDAADLANIADQVAAQESASYFLQAIRTDDDTGQCVGVFGDGEQVTVGLAAECDDPSSCAGLQVSLSNNGSADMLATTDSNGDVGAAAYSNVDLLFGAESKASFTFNYPDVGSVSLHARRRLENDDGTLSGDFMLGSSNSFVVSPASFAITAVSAGGNPNPGTTATGNGFVAAGDSFRVVVDARNALGNKTPNYGNETAAEGITINFSNLEFPAGGDEGLLNNPAAFTSTGTPGEFENTAITWSEVGSFTAYASVADGDYLGAGDVAGADSGTIGRFYPKQFHLQSSTLANSCVLGAFSYMSEPDITVSYEVEAHNDFGGIVLNYDNTALSYPAATVSVHGEAGNDGNDLAPRLSVAAGGWSSGVFLVSDSNASILRSGSPDGPLSSVAVGLRLADPDDASFPDLDFKPDANNNCDTDSNCDSKLLSGMLEARFGRLYVQDGHGPESAPIPMVWQTEYWNGSRFVLNSDDQCSELPLASVEFVGANSTTVNAASDTVDVSIGGLTSVFDFSDPSGTGDCLSATHIGFCDGRAGRAYGAPGSIVTYPISIDLSGRPWLQGDWDQDGLYNDSSFPQVNIRFQHYRGHDRIIYWREVFE